MALYLDYTGLSYYDNNVKMWVTDRIKNLTGSHYLSDNGENLLAVDPTDKGITLNRSTMTGLIKDEVASSSVNIDLATDSDVDGLFATD